MTNISKRIAALSPEQRALLELRLQQKDLKINKLKSIPKRKTSDILSLSLIQERLWFLHQLQPDFPLYNESSLFRITGNLNSVALEQSINEIIKRHEILRTAFQTINGQTLQNITPKTTLTLPIVDLQKSLKTEQEELVKQIVTEQSIQPFDLTQVPLLRGMLICLKPQEHIMLLTMHHIISDGWSWRVFYRELTTLYQLICNQNASPLPELPIQYADFALWQKQCLNDEGYKPELAYWKQKLENLPPVLALPTDNPRPAVQSFRGAREVLILPQALTEALKSLSQKEGVTLFMLLLAAFQTLLYRYTGQTDLVVGTPIANRNQIETENLLGCFINTLVLRTGFSQNSSFRELLARVRETTLAAYAHQDLPFEELVKELQPERTLSHNPLFQVMFVFQDTPLEALELPGLKFTPLIVDNGIAEFDLTLFLEDTKHQLMGALEYNTDLFKADTINRMIGHFQTLLEGIVSHPNENISILPLLNNLELNQLTLGWNQTKVDYPKDQCIHQLFEDQVERTPNAIAMVFEKQQLTYQELNERANQLARYLQKLGVGAEIPVGICVERSLEMVVGVLGILKAGGAYVPLEPTYPKERLDFILKDAQAKILLTQYKLAAALPESLNTVIYLDTNWKIIADESTNNLIENCTSENLAYIIYTSGSTGKPKGVMIPHQSIANRLLWGIKRFNLTTDDRIFQKTSLSFDVSVWEIFGALLSGACLVIAEPGGHQDSSYLVRMMVQQQITLVDFVPAMLQQILAEPNIKNCHKLRCVTCGGETLPIEVKNKFFAHLGKVELHNCYGPTEVSIDATSWLCTPDSSVISIGHPISNQEAYILDEYLQAVAIGVPGELYIGGAGLARGYLNHPELTAEKFIPHPFKQKTGARLYKTGDLARYLADGNIEFIGRRDEQIKIRGFRLEIGEIEAVLHRHPAIAEAAVLVLNDVRNGQSDKGLVAYFVPKQSNQQEQLSAHSIRSYLSHYLPDYMIPAAFVSIPQLPRNANGKLERQALPLPDIIRPKLDKEFVPAHTSIEVKLAQIWSEVLHIEKVGIYHDFFELGGHSLLATQVISRINQSFGIELPLRRLFELPTIVELAKSIAKTLQAVSNLVVLPIERVSRNIELPLSFAQQRLWFLQQLDPDSTAYNGSNILRLQGLLNAVALQQSINEIIRRHEVLRSHFGVVEGQLVQKIIPQLIITLPVIDLQNLPEAERQAEVQRRERTDAQQPFDLTQAPLLRLTLLRLDTTEHILLVTMHHIISDAWSGGVFIREVSALYEAFSHGLLSPLPELPIQYADFAVWQQQWLQGEVLETQLGYWKQQLEGAKTILELPTKKVRSQLQTSLGSKYNFTLSQDLSQSLKILNQQQGVTMFMALVTAFNTLLYYYTEQEDILIGTPIANRNRSEIEGLIGFFINTLVLRTNLKNNPTFQELLQQVREVALGAYTHQDLPFEKLISELQPERHLHHSPLFQVWFVLQNAPVSTLELEGLNLTVLEAETGVVRHDLKLDLSETAAGITGFFEYKTELFDIAAIAQMAKLFETLLKTVIEQPEIHLKQIVEILNETQKQEFQQARHQKLGKVSRKEINH